MRHEYRRDKSGWALALGCLYVFWSSGLNLAGDEPGRYTRGFRLSVGKYAFQRGARLLP